MKRLNNILSPYLLVVWLMAASVLWLDIQEGPHKPYFETVKTWMGIA